MSDHWSHDIRDPEAFVARIVTRSGGDLDYHQRERLHQFLLIELWQLSLTYRHGDPRFPSNFSGHAGGVLPRRVIDWRRSGARRVRILEKFPIDLMPAEAEDDAEPIDAERLKRCLSALPERERAVLVMTFYDDRPADAVAEELKLSAGNVRVIRHRGLERLRGCMTAEEGAA